MSTQRVFHRFILLHFSVADVDHAVGVQRDVVLMRHQHDSVAGAVQARKQRHDLVTGSGVERAGRLVRPARGRDYSPKARATATRWRWPPESSLGLCPMRWVN